jgi:ATP-binding cassette subfamily B multidrug efflux pump
VSKNQNNEKQAKPTFDRAVLLRIGRLASPYKKAFYMAIILTVVSAFLGPIRPYLIQYTIDQYISIANVQGVLYMSLLLLALLVLQTFLQWYNTILSNTLAQNVVKDLRNRVYTHLTSLKQQYYDNTPVGTLVTRTISDIETLADTFAEGLISISGDVLQIIFILSLMLYTDWKLTLVSLTVLPLLIYAGYIFKEKVRVSFEDVRNEVARLNTFVQEHLQGITIVQLFNRERQEYEKFKQINAKHRDANIRSVFYYSVFFPVVEILSAAATGLVVWYASIQIINHETTPGAMIAFIMYINLFFRPIRQVADRFNTLQMGMVASTRIFNLLDASEQLERNGTQKDFSLDTTIRFNQIWFAYKDEDYVLRDINLDIQQGNTLAIVGQTGSGKSTIINLICGLYTPTKGEILIGANTLSELHLPTLRSKLGIVLQDVFLFNGTIMDNITLYREGISEAQVIETAKQLGAHDFISKLPNGYYQMVNERGLSLSVGQRQLISFVRAMVTNPPLLILDEATSSIDHESEEIIQHAITHMMHNRTSIIIAHRLSTIQHAQKIVVMHQGAIVESGSHEELLSKNGRYFQLYTTQLLAASKGS